MSTTDEIMGMVQEYASAWSIVGSCFDNGHGMECAEEARAALFKAVEALAADAARYRWLRATMNWVSSHGQRIDVRNDPELLDASIDGMIAVNAAMKGTP